MGQDPCGKCCLHESEFFLCPSALGCYQLLIWCEPESSHSELDKELSILQSAAQQLFSCAVSFHTD